MVTADERTPKVGDWVSVEGSSDLWKVSGHDADHARYLVHNGDNVRHVKRADVRFVEADPYGGVRIGDLVQVKFVEGRYVVDGSSSEGLRLRRVTKLGLLTDERVGWVPIEHVTVLQRDWTPGGDFPCCGPHGTGHDATPPRKRAAIELESTTEPVRERVASKWSVPRSPAASRGALDARYSVVTELQDGEVRQVRSSVTLTRQERTASSDREPVRMLLCVDELDGLIDLLTAHRDELRRRRVITDYTEWHDGERAREAAEKAVAG